MPAPYTQLGQKGTPQMRYGSFAGKASVSNVVGGCVAAIQVHFPGVRAVQKTQPGVKAAQKVCE